MAQLQSHRPRVAFPTFGTHGFLQTYAPTYKNVTRTHGHRTVLPDVLLPTNMKRHAKDQINHIIDRIDSLDNLSADDITELRRISERPLVLHKLKVSPAEYWNWLNKIGDDIRGVEYDAQNEHIILKERPGPMHEAATWLIGSTLFRELGDRLSAVTGSCYSLSGSTNCSLAGDFKRSVKEADASIKKVGAQFPAVVLEVGISQTTSKLYRDAERWLHGGLGQTKLVILVDVQETNRRHTLDDKWDLSTADFQQMHYQALFEHILQWYRTKGISLVGTFKLSVHLWYSDGDRQCILDKAVFSPGNLIDLTTTNDVPLRLEHLMPAGSGLDVSQRLLFPLRRLVEKLQNGFEDVEIQRVSDLADNDLSS